MYAGGGGWGLLISDIRVYTNPNVIGRKVSHYNSLLVETLSNVDNVTIVETIPFESRLFYVDNLHLSKLGLRHVSGMILSSLYRVLAPDLYWPKAKKFYSVSDLN